MFGSDFAALASLLEQCPAAKPVVREQPKMQVSIKTKECMEAERLQKAESIFEDADVIVPKAPAANTKKQPEFEILFQQHVNAEDVFFNLRDVDNSSDHCEHLTVKIAMPGAVMKDITLDVFPDRLVVQSGEYYLSLALPQPVKKDDGTAKWDKISSTLQVVLPIARVVRYVTDPSAAYTSA